MVASYALNVANEIERQQPATVNVLAGESAGGGAYEHRHIECRRSGLVAGFYSGAHNPQDADATSSMLCELVAAKMNCVTEVEGGGAGGRGYEQRCVEAYLSGFVDGLHCGAANPQLAKYTFSEVVPSDHQRSAESHFTEFGTCMLIKETATVTVCPQLAHLCPHMQ